MLLLLTQCVKIFICFFILDLDLGSRSILLLKYLITKIA